MDRVSATDWGSIPGRVEYKTMKITDKFDILRGRLLGNHNDFHWQLGG